MMSSTTVLRAWALSMLVFSLAATGCGSSDGDGSGNGGRAGLGGTSGGGGMGGSAGAGGVSGTGGDAGAGGSAGAGGMAGADGMGGSGGIGGAMCDSAQDCADDNACTDDVCNPIDEVCDNPPVEDGTSCDAGGGLGSCQEGSCVADLQWRIAEKISGESTSTASAPQVASDGNGNVIAVWQEQDNASTYHVWARRYTRAGGWGAAQRISDGTSAADRPRIATDSAGNAIVVWSQFERKVTDLLTIHNIWANRYAVGNGWGTPEIIEENAGNAGSADVASNPAGMAMVVWHQYPDGNGHQHIWGRKYDPSQGWDITRAVELNPENSSQPRPAVDADGNAIAVWVQKSDIWTNRYTAVNGWGTSEPLTETGSGASGPAVAIDSAGNAMAVWARSDCSATCNAWAARYPFGGDWTEPEAINGQGRWAYSFDLAFDASGTAMALWSQSDGTRPNIWNNRYDPRTGWGSAALVEQSPAGAGEANFGFDADGNAVAVWHENSEGTYSIESANFTPLGGWAVSERIDGGGAVLSDAPEVAVDLNGEATAVWYEYDGLKHSVWAARYD